MIRDDRPAGGSNSGEFGFKQVYDLRCNIAALDQRARDWLSGQANWFFKQYVEGNIGIVLEFGIGDVEALIDDGDVNHSVSPASSANFGIFEMAHGGRWRNDPVLVDVVGCHNSPDKITEGPRSVVCAIRLNVLQNHSLQLGIFPAEFVERAGTSWFLGPTFRRTSERLLQPIAFFVEGENNIVIGKSGVSGEARNQVVERAAEASYAVSQSERDPEWNGDVIGREALAINTLRFAPYGGVRISLDPLFPSGANLIRVLSCPI